MLLYCMYISDYRESNADKPLNHHLRAQESTFDSNHFHPTVHRYHTAHLRSRHGVTSYDSETENNKHLKYWTLPKASSATYTEKPIKEEKRLHSPVINPEPNIIGRAEVNVNTEESIRISPIDPRNSGSFKSSTPTNRETTINLNSKLLSPVKSTMTNEELYAVIHRSKKKLNIKEPSERAESPAFSTINVSPLVYEPSLPKSGQRFPETGYLDIKNRPAKVQDKQILNPSGPSAQKRETCADRYGPTQQTSRLDFKKLLLQHSVKVNTLNVQSKSYKLSAVEQLKLSKEKNQTPLTPPGNKSQINILDLSGSPKTYNHRKCVKSNNQPMSPGRSSGLLKDHKNTSKVLLSPKSQWRFASPRSDVLSTPIPEANNEDEISNSSGEKYEATSPSPPLKTVPIMTNQHFGARRSLIPISEYNLDEERTNTSLDQGVFPIDTDFPSSHALSRSEIIQAKRNEFFKSPQEPAPQLSSFKKSPSNLGLVLRNKTSPEREKSSPSTLETAL